MEREKEREEKKKEQHSNKVHVCNVAYYWEKTSERRLMKITDVV